MVLCDVVPSSFRFDSSRLFRQELQAESRLEAAFTYHAVRDLRKTLRSVGSDLVLRSGDAAEEVKKIVDEAGVTHVFFHSRCDQCSGSKVYCTVFCDVPYIDQDSLSEDGDRAIVAVNAYGKFDLGSFLLSKSYTLRSHCLYFYSDRCVRTR